METGNIMDTVVQTSIMHGCQQNLQSLKNGKGKTKKRDNKEIHTQKKSIWKEWAVICREYW
jgi:hypothetical protein